MTTPRLLALAALVGFVLALSVAATGGEAAPAAAVRSDFNGDGFADLAVGVPFEDVGTIRDAGAVNVIYGSATGLEVADNVFLRRGSSAVPGSPQSGDHFGAALASGDFDGNGFSDLAIGIPDIAKFGNADEGMVLILYGSPNGLARGQYYDVRSATGGSTDGCDCRFGAALAAGDFRGDSRDDLAIGMPGQDLERDSDDPEREGERELVSDVGAVLTLRGYDFGLSASSGSWDLIVPESLPAGLDAHSLRGVVGGEFGAGLAVGDVGGDARDDLVIGAPGSRRVHVILGPTNNHYTDTPRSVYGGGSAGSDSWFGRVLALGDIDGDGKQAIFVGDPFDDPGGVDDAGSVSVFVAGTLMIKLTQSTLLGVAKEVGDRFGYALATGDLDGDGRDDLAIGVPNENIGSTLDPGIVNVLYSRRVPLDVQSTRTFSQASPGIPGAVEEGDWFGKSLAACNLGNGVAADLAIGVPLEDFTAGGLTRTTAGVVDVLYGSRLTGLTTTGAQDWSQATTGMSGGFESGDQFGTILAC